MCDSPLTIISTRQTKVRRRMRQRFNQCKKSSDGAKLKMNRNFQHRIVFSRWKSEVANAKLSPGTDGWSSAWMPRREASAWREEPIARASTPILIALLKLYLLST